MATHPDPGAFEEFYSQHYGLVLAVARRRLIGERGDAEDAASEVFRVAWARHSAGNDLTLPWLYATLRNVIGTEYRRRKRLVGFLQRSASCPPDLGAADDADIRADIHAAMRRLRPRDRELLYMAYWDDLTPQEIGDVLGLRRDVVHARLSRARGALRRLLGGTEGYVIGGEAMSNG